MARLSLTEQIAKAAVEGDFEKVRVLGEKLKLQQAEPKPKVKPKAKTKVIEEEYEGDDRRVARRSPMLPIKRENTFKDNLKIASADINFDKSWYNKVGDTPTQREKVKKIKVICSRCNQSKTALSNDVIHAGWTCETCLRNIRG